ncbi:MAG TPA: hypothetical protein VGZ02_05760 [Candidatus Baltobacteraceae bacterium]|jgi:hypothetical protein|nr:hypothetical protein [Candidatus Baltobacteraceae bacterium]
MNLINGLISGAEGYLTSGSPATALEMGAIGSMAGGGSTIGNLAGDMGNSALGALDAQNETFQLAMYGEQMRHQEQMQIQSQAFDEMMDEKSEQMREINTLRDVQMAQRKADNAITKKFIQSIAEE